MAYTKQTWADLPSKTTPINATRLGHIEDGIFNAAATADNAASAAGTAAADVGIVSGKVETLTERVNGLDTAVGNKVDKVAGKGLSTNDYDNTDKGKVDSLGTASTKNSTSVVTQSTDLVESGAVKDIIGWGNKNKLIFPYVSKSFTSLSNVNFIVDDEQQTVEVSSDSVSSGNPEFVLINVTDNRFEGYIFSTGFASENVKARIRIARTDGTFIREIYTDENGNLTIPTLESEQVFSFRIRVLISSGTIPTSTFYPMISKDGGAREPYHASVEKSKVGWDKATEYVSRNLFDEDYSNISSAVLYRVIYVGSGTFTMSTNAPLNSTDGANLFFLAGKVSGGASTGTNGVYINNPRTVTAVDGFVTVVYRNTGGVDPNNYNTQIEKDSKATAYTPYLPSNNQLSYYKADNSVIGTVEGANASKAWSKGEHFIQDGQFKEVTQPIASGEAIDDGNTTDRPIAELFDDILTYSTSETLTGSRWIDGKPIYRKVVDIGALPDTTQASISHGITNLGTLISANGAAVSDANLRIPIPFAHETQLSNDVRLMVNDSSVIIACGTNRTNYNGFVILEYTKSA